MLTSEGLIAFAKTKLGSPYAYGINGELVTEALLKYKATQYPKRYTPDYLERTRKAALGKVAYDCSTLSDLYCGVDHSANGWLDLAKETWPINYIPSRGPIKKIPEIPGLHVHYDGHMGIYLGDGWVLEARGVAYGVVTTRIDSLERGWTAAAKNYTLQYGGEDMEKIAELQAEIVKLKAEVTRQTGYKEDNREALDAERRIVLALKISLAQVQNLITTIQNELAALKTSTAAEHKELVDIKAAIKTLIDSLAK